MEPVIELSSVFFTYEKSIILEDISLRVLEKDFLTIVGPNGGGKTTLLKLIMGFLKPVKGSINIFGKPPKINKARIGYVPQFAAYKEDFPLNALDVVLTGLLDKESFLPWYSKQDKNAALSVMDKLGILNLAKEKIGTLSGGQKQRVLIARALVSNPAILLLDEPTASVDPKNEKHIYEFLKEMNDDITILLVTHDVTFVSHYANSVACLNKKISVNTVKKIPGQLEEYYHTPMDFITHNCGL